MNSDNHPKTILYNKYQLLRLIGSGGMGDVYEAENLSIGRRVAIKTIQKQKRNSESAVARFVREAQHAGTIGHDNICEVIDFFMADDDPYIVMPLLSGASLRDILDRDGPLPLGRVVDIIGQVLSALTAAHREQIVHRDLKPDNIFITCIGDRADFVKVLDFGISKILDDSLDPDLTDTGIVRGTPYYMAPEQAEGQRGFDHRIDIYAIGVILYELLTGRRPILGDNYNEILSGILQKPVTPPCLINPEIPDSMQQVILKAMSRDIQERYESADAMRTALFRATGVADRAGSASGSHEAFQPSKVQPSSRTAISLTTPETWVKRESDSSETPQPQGHSPWRSRALGIAAMVFITIMGLLWVSSSSNSAEPPVLKSPAEDSVSSDALPEAETANPPTKNVHSNRKHPIHPLSVPKENLAPDEAEAETKAEAKAELARPRENPSAHDNVIASEEKKSPQKSSPKKTRRAKKRNRPVMKPKPNKQLREAEGPQKTQFILDYRQ